VGKRPRASQLCHPTGYRKEEGEENCSVPPFSWLQLRGMNRRSGGSWAKLWRAAVSDEHENNKDASGSLQLKASSPAIFK
jgi:hypothetical protein